MAFNVVALEIKTKGIYMREKVTFIFNFGQ